MHPTAEDGFQTLEDTTVELWVLDLIAARTLVEYFAVGADVGATAWWDLAVPPGVIPGAAESFHETTLVTYGLGASRR